MLTDLEPSIPISELELDIPPWSKDYAKSPFVCSTVDTALFMADSTNPAVDTSSAAYIAATEKRWRAEQADLEPSVRRPESDWADFRYNW